MVLRWPLRSVEERRDGVLILVLTGRISAESAPQLRAALAGVLGRGDVRLVIDLTGVDYISSAGLHVLEEAAALCAGGAGALALCGVVHAVKIAIDLGGLTSQILMEPSRESAIARVSAPN